MRVFLIGQKWLGAEVLSLLQRRGYDVAGSDEHVYPPMSTYLDRLGIPVLEGYTKQHLETFRPDLVVRDSVEYAALVAAERDGVRHARVAVHSVSFEEAIPPLVAAPVAIAKEGRRPPFEVVQAQGIPFRGVLQFHRELRVLVLDQFLPRIAAIHADQPIEHELEIARRPIPIHWANDRPRVREVERHGLRDVVVPHVMDILKRELT